MSSSLLLKEKTRKRTRNPEKHVAFQQKVKVQKGLEHKSKSGKIIKAKIFREQTQCTGGCKKQCTHKINIVRQKEVFETFYNLENFSKKTLYLRSFVKTQPYKEDLKSVKCTSKRASHKYYLTDNKGEHQEVL